MKPSDRIHEIAKKTLPDGAPLDLEGLYFRQNAIVAYLDEQYEKNKKDD